MSSDPRILVRIGDRAMHGPGEAVLLEGAAAAPSVGPWERFRLPALGDHPSGCACCLPRGPVAEALSRLFLARARGEVDWFGAVVAVPTTAAGRRAIEDALERDPLVRARFRSAT